MVIRSLTASKAPMVQATRLAPDIQVNTNGITTFGAVAGARGYSSNARRMPSAVVLTLDNSAGVAKALYKIGDPNGIVASKFSITAAAATSASGLSVAAFTASLNQGPLLVKGINYEATSGLVQFSERFQFGDADLDRGQLIDLVVPQYIRNTSQNPNLLTLDFDEGFELDWNSGFIVEAGIGQLVKVTLMIGAAAGR
jgi:hypothetical protein